MRVRVKEKRYLCVCEITRLYKMELGDTGKFESCHKFMEFIVFILLTC